MTQLPRSLKKSVLTLAYCYRRATSPLRKLPDFVIIGAQKCGTSSLYYYLSQHPQLEMSAEKEIHYYNYYIDHGRGLNWYKSFFPLKMRDAGRMTGEASPNYLYLESAAEKLKKDVPDVKLIVLLRNPIDRAYSEYNMHVRQLKRDDFPTFEQAIANPELSMEASRVYLLRGIYAEHIKNWMKHFDRDRFLFIKSEDLFGNPQPVLKNAYEFLGLDEVYPDSLKAQEVGAYSDLLPETHAMLKEYFSKPNQELVELLGERFRWETGPANAPG